MMTCYVRPSAETFKAQTPPLIAGSWGEEEEAKLTSGHDTLSNEFIVDYPTAIAKVKTQDLSPAND